MTNIEIIILSLRYKRSKIRCILLDVNKDGSNIAEVSAKYNIPVEAITHWYERSQHTPEAYDLDRCGFVLAKISK